MDTSQVDLRNFKTTRRVPYGLRRVWDKNYGVNQNAYLIQVYLSYENPNISRQSKPDHKQGNRIWHNMTADLISMSGNYVRNT
jgi:hypothetical protein